MNTFVRRSLVVLACFAGWCWAGAPATAQVRSGVGVGFSSPGTMSTVGLGQTHDFRTHSAGIGGLQTTGGGYQLQGVLRSSMSNTSQSGWGLRSSIDTSVGRGSKGAALRSDIDRTSGGLISSSSVGGGRVGSTVLSTVSAGGTLTRAADFALASAGGTGMAGAILGQDTSLTAARGFIASVGAVGGLDKSDESIKTLVPDQPGKYRDMMQKGEELMQSGSFIAAYEQFKVASDILGRSPEPFLSMAHARFGVGGYGTTAFYIRRALAYMPQLPLVPLRPKNFYSNVAVFGDLIIRLKSYLDENPDNGDALLILAYFRWFADDSDVAAVRVALEKALAVSESEERIEAIHIFWRAILESGKATGELRIRATTRPSSATGGSTTRPADQASEGEKATGTVRPAKTSSTAGERARQQAPGSG